MFAFLPFHRASAVACREAVSLVREHAAGKRIVVLRYRAEAAGVRLLFAERDREERCWPRRGRGGGGTGRRQLFQPVLGLTPGCLSTVLGFGGLAFGFSPSARPPSPLSARAELRLRGLRRYRPCACQPSSRLELYSACYPDESVSFFLGGVPTRQWCGAEGDCDGTVTEPFGPSLEDRSLGFLSEETSSRDGPIARWQRGRKLLC